MCVRCNACGGTCTALYRMWDTYVYVQPFATNYASPSLLTAAFRMYLGCRLWVPLPMLTAPIRYL